MPKRATALITSLALIASATAVVAAPAAADVAIAGTYNTVALQRIVDTRSGLGLAKAPVGARSSVTFNAVLPLGAASASAVSLMITAVLPAKGGYFVVYPGGSARPVTSAVNFVAGVTAANGAVTGVGPAGTVTVYNNSAAPVELVVDATGYWTAGTVDASTAGALHVISPQRLYDTRTAGAGAIAALSERPVTVSGVAGVPASGVSAVILNATAATPTDPGFLSVTEEAETADTRTSTVNFTARASRADMVAVSLAVDGTISLYNGSAAPLDVALDVVGYISDGGPFEDGAILSSTTYRSNDDRIDAAPLAANTTRSYPLVPGDDEGSIFRSAIVTITAVDATRPGYFVFLNGDGSIPRTSSMNHQALQTVAQSMIVPLRPDGSIALRNVSMGTVDLIVDVTGFVLKSELVPNRAAPDRVQAAHRIEAELTKIHRAAAIRLHH